MQVFDIVDIAKTLWIGRAAVGVYQRKCFCRRDPDVYGVSKMAWILCVYMSVYILCGSTIFGNRSIQTTKFSGVKFKTLSKAI